MNNRIPICLLLVCLAFSAFAARPLKGYCGGGNPARQGWIEGHDKKRAAEGKPAEEAWRVEDDDDAGPEGLYYRMELSETAREVARRVGFVYRWRLRIMEETKTPTLAIGTEVCVQRLDGRGRLRLGLQLGRRGEELVGKFHTGTHGAVEGAVRVKDAGGFHDWELMFEGRSRTVNLRVDGRLVLSALCDNDDSGHHLVFGSRSTGTGVADWAWVGFYLGLPARVKLVPPPVPPFRTHVFVSGKEGYFAFRIPSLLVTPKGTLLAFAEGRKQSLADLGNNDMVLKRSTDGGKTWGPLQIIYDEGESTIGNPTPVVDRDTGRVWLVFGREAKQVLVMHSDDEGKSWSKPVDITKQVTRPKWKFYGVGPGVGIQLRAGNHKNRLVIPAYHRLTQHKNSSPFAHVFYSDDHGKSWKSGGTVGPESCESQVAETANGGLIINCRNHWRRTGGKPRWGGKRIVARSQDGGATWSKPVLDETLIEQTCQASLLRYSWPGKDSRGLLLFANPAATPTGDWGGPRHRLTVRLSHNDGKSWPVSKLVEAGPAAYSSLARLPDARIGIVYESGNYKQITFAAFDLGWLSPRE
jgi:sialidase-1